MSGIPILCYHNIGAAPAPGRFALLHVAEAKLERQLWALRRLGLRGVSMTEGLARLGAGAPRGAVVMTFDDGYRDTLTAALPLLRRYDCRATCYVVSDCIGGHNRWDDDQGRERHALMTRDQIGSWLEAGMEIGSHTLSHPWLDRLGAAEAAAEISESRASLQRTFGVTVDHFAYPFGKYTPDVVDAVKRTGYASAVTGEPGIARAGGDAHRLPRLIVDGRRGLARFLLRLAAPYGDLRYLRGLLRRVAPAVARSARHHHSGYDQE
jgi:peptidoglycan/xylan/chitin deacetylase (PgdA/CDA1 family)